MELIDVHAHHYPDAYLDACQRPDSGLETYRRDDGRIVVLQDGAVALAAPQPLPSVADRLGRMDDAGIATQLISVSAPSVYRLPDAYRASITREVNDEMVEYARGANGRLRILATLPLPDVDAALAELDRTLAMPEVAGAFLCTTLDRRTLDDPFLVPLLEELSRQDVAVLVHPSVACCTDGIREYALALGFDYMAETTNAVARLVFSGTLERYPGIRWVFTHLGGTVPFIIHRFDNYYRQFPECRAHIDRAPSEILRRVFFDTVTTHAPALRCALDTFAPDQLLFGTDYPHVPGGLEIFVETVRRVVTDDELFARIGWRTARDVFALDTVAVARKE